MSWTAYYLPEDEADLSRGGFETEEDAWLYAEKYYCTDCYMSDRCEPIPCECEWMVLEEDK